ncbi:MAG: hypothetical protein V3T08_02790, partial [Gemmatimonadota bacterium]
VQEFSAVGVESQTQTHASDSATRFTIHRTDSGYDVRAEQVSTMMTKDGEPVDDPVTDLLRRMPATYQTDPDGRLVGIRGFEQVSERIALELPSELSSLLASVITEEALAQRGAEEWNGRYGDFIGRTIRIGDVLPSSKSTEFVGGVNAIEYTATWFPENVKCSGRDCVHVRIFRNTNLEALKERLAKEVGQRAAGLFHDLGDARSPEGFESSIEIDRLVDPTTLLTQRETQRRLVTRQVPISAEVSGVLKMNETKQYTFEYTPLGEVSAERP